MQRVTGIGGVFFRAKDPVALARWYQDRLGVTMAPTEAGGTPWMTEAGVTVFAPFAADTGYFAPESQFMINFRVTDLSAMVAQLRAGGITVSDQTEMEGVGRFARLQDPEGTPIELWEPAS